MVGDWTNISDRGSKLKIEDFQKRCHLQKGCFTGIVSGEPKEWGVD